jgi:uncharacterized protein (TIGR02594 family)
VNIRAEFQFYYDRKKGNDEMSSPPWFEIARQEIGVHVYPPGLSNPRISQYHCGSNIEGYDDKASWCSTFVNWSLAQVGIQGTKSALARSWLDWGQALDRPRQGCIAVLWREEPGSWKGHVGFYLRHDLEHIYLLGGNQLKAVREHAYPVASVLSYRWPAQLAVGHETQKGIKGRCK